MLGPNSYGKSDIRVVKVVRGPDRHDIHDLTVDVAVQGDFDAAHTTGDNRGLMATDTMRNIVYAVAQELDFEDPEPFALAVAARVNDVGANVTRARVRASQHPWARLDAHAFQRAPGGRRIAIATADGEVEAGIEDLALLRTAGSAFEGFQRDRYTTLPETRDRILATTVTATWDYRAPDPDYGRIWRGARDRILQSFADHESPSVQYTLHRMGQAVLHAHEEIERIHLALPNIHHLPVGEGNEVFQATTEPHGLIEATVEASGR